MYDPLKKDVTITISRLELMHGELRTRYERAKADHDALYERYSKAVHDLDEAEHDYALIDRALKAMDALRDGKSIEDIDSDEDDCYF